MTGFRAHLSHAERLELFREPKGYAGDWIPYGRLPYELLPEIDYGEPIGKGRDVGGQNLRRWHKLRKAGLR